MTVSRRAGNELGRNERIRAGAILDDHALAHCARQRLRNCAAQRVARAAGGKGTTSGWISKETPVPSPG